MSIDRTTLISCVVVPGGILSIAAAFAWWFGRGLHPSLLGVSSKADKGAESYVRNKIRIFGCECCTWDEVRSSIAAGAMAIGWSAALLVPVFSKSNFDLWPDDSWPRFLLPMFLSALLLGPLVPTHHLQRPFAWLVYGVLACIAAMFIMPTGDSWSDLLPLHRPWMAAIQMAVPLNAYLLWRMSIKGADRWLPWIVLAYLGCAAIVGAASYSALLDGSSAAITATLFFIFFRVFGWIRTSAVIVFPAMVATATLIASGRFYSYVDIPPWAYGTALFLPSIVASIDAFLPPTRTLWRVITAAAVASTIVGLTAYRFLA